MEKNGVYYVVVSDMEEDAGVMQRRQPSGRSRLIEGKD